MATSAGQESSEVGGAEVPTALVRRAALIEELSRKLVAVGERRRSEVGALDAEVAELRGRLLDPERGKRTQRHRADRLARQLEDLRTSETWRVGAAAMWLPRRIRWALSTR